MYAPVAATMLVTQKQTVAACSFGTQLFRTPWSRQAHTTHIRTKRIGVGVATIDLSNMFTISATRTPLRRFPWERTRINECSLTFLFVASILFFPQASVRVPRLRSIYRVENCSTSYLCVPVLVQQGRVSRVDVDAAHPVHLNKYTGHARTCSQGVHTHTKHRTIRHARG